MNEEEGGHLGRKEESWVGLRWVGVPSGCKIRISPPRRREEVVGKGRSLGVVVSVLAPRILKKEKIYKRVTV